MAAPTGRRQSTRQVGKTSRPQNYYARNFGARATDNAPATSNNSQPGFFPAITHFTNAVDALPKEVIRHFSMIKEVEAKLHAPDDQMQRVTDTVTRLPPPTTQTRHTSFNHLPAGSVQNGVTGSRAGSVAGTQVSNGTQGTEEMEDRQRQLLFHHVNASIVPAASALEEKIAVLTTANQTLQRQLDRMLSSFLHMPDEISAEARLGNPKHWAYVTDKEPKKAPERSRREVANANTLAAAAAAVAADDHFASRSEARREAVAARKGRNQQIDSDFDDRPTSKKAAKGKKPVEAAKPVGLGIANGEVKVGKKKRAHPLERSLSGTNITSRPAQASPHQTPELGPKKTKRKFPGESHKKRAFSPAQTSSPVLGSLATKDPPLRPGGQNRVRQDSSTNSVQSANPDKGTRPPSAQSNPAPNGLPATLPYDNPEPTAALAEQEMPATQPEQVSVPKSEDVDMADDGPLPESTQPAIITTRAGRQSKTATPLSSTFPDAPRNRVARNKDPAATGSHASSESGEGRSRRTNAGKKNGNGTSNGSAATSIRADDDEVPLSAAAAEGHPQEEAQDEEVEEPVEEGNEPKYCYCNDVSYGEMVACDNEDCEREWFHLKCAGLGRAPDENTKWYCDNCKATMQKRARPTNQRE